MTSDPKLGFDKLWIVVFFAGVDLENEFQFLPKIKTRMLNSVPAKDVTQVLYYFYFFQDSRTGLRKGTAINSLVWHGRYEGYFEVD